MKRIRAISRTPRHAAIAPEVVMTYIMNLLEISLPLFTNKNPKNPLPPAGTGGTGT